RKRAMKTITARAALRRPSESPVRPLMNGALMVRPEAASVLMAPGPSPVLGSAVRPDAGAGSGGGVATAIVTGPGAPAVVTIPSTGTDMLAVAGWENSPATNQGGRTSEISVSEGLLAREFTILANASANSVALWNRSAGARESARARKRSTSGPRSPAISD